MLLNLGKKQLETLIRAMEYFEEEWSGVEDLTEQREILKGLKEARDEAEEQENG